MREPEHEEAEEEIVNFDKPAFEFKPNGFHAYRQQGPYLVCKSCEITHAIWVGMKKQLVGFNDQNKPILKNV